MKTLLLAAAGAAVVLSTAPAALAAQGCGPGFHRGYYGACRPNYGPVVGGPVIGTFYRGHGYWYGNRYWGHRYRYGGGWRYR